MAGFKLDAVEVSNDKHIHVQLWKKQKTCTIQQITEIQIHTEYSKVYCTICLSNAPRIPPISLQEVFQHTILVYHIGRNCQSLTFDQKKGQCLLVTKCIDCCRILQSQDIASEQGQSQTTQKRFSEADITGYHSLIDNIPVVSCGCHFLTTVTPASHRWVVMAISRISQFPVVGSNFSMVFRSVFPSYLNR